MICPGTVVVIKLTDIETGDHAAFEEKTEIVIRV
jgi:hypothetical protein